LLPSVQLPFAAFCSPDPDILSQESRGRPGPGHPYQDFSPE
jgi:hypothetical protein